MLNGKLMLAALGVIQDRETHAISIFSIAEEIQAEGFPILVQKMGLLAVLERASEDSSQHRLSLTVSLGETELASSPVVADFQDKLRTNCIINMQGLVIPNPGQVKFELKDGPRSLCTYTFNATPRSPVTIQSVSAP